MDEVLDKKASKALFTSSYPWILLASIIILGAVLYLSLVTGRYSMSTEDLYKILAKNWLGANYRVYKPDENLLFNVRLPRLVAAGLIGAALAIAGATFQAVFRNPLVSPYLLGVSQGASVGAATAILLGIGTTLAIQGSALCRWLSCSTADCNYPPPTQKSVHPHAGTLRRYRRWFWNSRARGT